MKQNEDIAAYLVAILRIKDSALVLALLTWWCETHAAFFADVVNNKALPLFGALLRLVCMRAGLTQTRLGRDSKEYVKAFKEMGWMKWTDTVDVGQSAISDACRGELEPSFDQLRIWLYAIRAVYEDPQFKQKCELKKMPFYEFSFELEKDIWYLALKGYDDDIIEAYQRQKKMILQLARQEWWNGLEPDSDTQDDQDTDPRLPIITRYSVSSNDYSPRKAISAIQA